MVLKVLKKIVRRVIDVATGREMWVEDYVGKKVSIYRLCREGKLHPRKCRKYRMIE